MIVEITEIGPKDAFYEHPCNLIVFNAEIDYIGVVLEPGWHHLRGCSWCEELNRWERTFFHQVKFRVLIP